MVIESTQCCSFSKLHLKSNTLASKLETVETPLEMSHCIESFEWLLAMVTFYSADANIKIDGLQDFIKNIKECLNDFYDCLPQLDILAMKDFCSHAAESVKELGILCESISEK